jgi:hypothetical protein
MFVWSERTTSVQRVKGRRFFPLDEKLALREDHWSEGAARVITRHANLVFAGNFASNAAGGLLNDASSPTMSNVSFTGNAATVGGGGLLNQSGSNPTLTNVTFSGNTAEYAGGMYNNANSNPALVGITFSGNVGVHGGAMFNWGSSPTLVNVTFSGNVATTDGGGMINHDGSIPTLMNVSFAGNSATYGGGMFNSSSDAVLINVSFSGNAAVTYGGGAFNVGSNPVLTNSILWGNTASEGPQIYNDASNPSISHSLIEGSGGSGTGWDASLGSDGGSNVDADPLFVREPDPGPDATWGTDDDHYGDLHLQGRSPAVNAGDNAALPADALDLDHDGGTGEPIPIDLAGNPRVVGTAVDMGAYECQSILYYVDADASGAGTGLSWGDAFTTLQDALDVAACGDEIWVAEGVYRPTNTVGRDATFQLKKGVALYGGFDPTGGDDAFEERDWETNVTVLSGDRDGNDTTDANGVVTDTAHIAGANAYHIVTSNDVTETAVLDGFTVTAGKADGGDIDDSGGGMYNYGGSPTLANVAFSGNAAADSGGGMYSEDSDLLLTDVSFLGNSAGWGGGAYNNQSDATFIGVSFAGNFADHGGGMHNVNSSPVLIDVALSGNAATQGGGMSNLGSNPTLVNVTFHGNTASSMVL